MLLTEKMVKVLQGRRVVYLLHDNFSKDAAAPLAASIASLPGPGLMSKAVDVSNLGSIVGSQMVLVGKGSNTDPEYHWTRNDGSAFPRVQGRTLLGRVRTDANGTTTHFGWTSIASAGLADAALFTGGGNLTFRELAGSQNYVVGLMPHNAGGLDMFFALVMRSVNADLYAFGGPLSRWSFLWRGVGGASAYYPFLGTFTNNGISYLSRARVVDLPAPFNTDAAVYSLNVASPVTATNYPGDINGFLELTVVSPGVLTGPMELNYRYVDDNNRWVAYFDSTGAFKTDSIVSSVRTNRVNIAGIATAGHTYHIRVRSLGTTHNFYTDDGAQNYTRRGAQIDVATPMDSVGTVRPVLASNWTMANLRSIPVQAYAYDNAFTKV